MKKLLFTVIYSLWIVIGFSQQTSPERSVMMALTEQDISAVTKSLADMDTIKNKNSSWFSADKKFYQLWLEGARNELSGKLKVSIKKYLEAEKVSRYEMSTYEVKLPLARAYLQNGDKSRAKTILNEYRQEANIELNDDNPEWALTDEGKAKLKKDLETCSLLISFTQN